MADDSNNGLNNRDEDITNDLESIKSNPETSKTETDSSQPQPSQISLFEINTTSTPFESQNEIKLNPILNDKSPETKPNIDSIDTDNYSSNIQGNDRPSIKDLEPIEQQVKELTRGEMIVETNLEMRRLKWTAENGRKHLIESYGKKSRQHC